MNTPRGGQRDGAGRQPESEHGARDKQLIVRVNDHERGLAKHIAAKAGFKSVSDFVRDKIFNFDSENTSK